MKADAGAPANAKPGAKGVKWEGRNPDQLVYGSRTAVETALFTVDAVQGVRAWYAGEGLPAHSPAIAAASGLVAASFVPLGSGQAAADEMHAPRSGSCSSEDM